MRKFKDKKGREWSVDLTYGALEKVKVDLGIDLLDLGNTEGLKKLEFDIPTFINFLFVICEEQCQAAGVSEEDFGRAFGGSVFDDAYEVLKAEYVDFFPKSQRPVLTAALGEMEEATKATIQAATEAVTGPAVKAALQQKVEEFKASVPGIIATALRGSPA